MEEIRLNKFIAERGQMSRRKADQLIEAGGVLVNGKTAETGMKVSDADEIVLLNGGVLKKTAPEKVIIALHKPRGVVSTTRSFPGETNVLTLVNYPERLYPVGRLDKDSSGLIFLTNDGDFARAVTNAAGQHEKEYEVRVDKEISPEMIEKLSAGMYLEELDKKTAPCKAVKTGPHTVTITLTQGLNRQIRRMVSALGAEVLTLKRVRIMSVRLGNLKEGSWRLLEKEEKEQLLKEAGVAENGSDAR